MFSKTQFARVTWHGSAGEEREFIIDKLLVRTHFIIGMIWWTGLAPWEFEFPFPGSLTSTFMAGENCVRVRNALGRRTLVEPPRSQSQVVRTHVASVGDSLLVTA